MPRRTLSLPDVPEMTSEARPPAAPMAIALLKADHTNTVVLFDAYLAAKVAGDMLTKRAIAIQIAAELTVHATIEEEIFYPAARAALSEEGDSLIDEAESDHAQVKSLIAQLTEAVEIQPLPTKVDTIVKKITEAVIAHVEEEETEIFPDVEAAGADLTSVGLALHERKQELKAVISKAGRAVVASMVKQAKSIAGHARDARG